MTGTVICRYTNHDNGKLPPFCTKVSLIFWETFWEKLPKILAIFFSIFLPQVGIGVLLAFPLQRLHPIAAFSNRLMLLLHQFLHYTRTLILKLLPHQIPRLNQWPWLVQLLQYLLSISQILPSEGFSLRFHKIVIHWQVGRACHVLP